MKIWCRILSLMSACVWCHGASANEAVKEASAFANVSAATYRYDGGYDNGNGYLLEAGVTTPMPDSEYFAFSVNGGHQEDRQKWSNGGWHDEFKTRQTGLGANLIVRDANIGSILAGYGLLHERWSYRYWGNGWNGRYSDSANVNVWTLKGEYYAGPITLALRQQNLRPADACCDSKESGVSTTFYPTDNHLLKATASRIDYDAPQGFSSRHHDWYQAGFESQPEIFDQRLKFGGGYAWSNDDRSGTKMLNAKYYFPQ